MGNSIANDWSISMDPAALDVGIGALPVVSALDVEIGALPVVSVWL